ncbi:MAG: TrbC/VirB2 family protein [Patescibacteria group bacterium]
MLYQKQKRMTLKIANLILVILGLAISSPILAAATTLTNPLGSDDIATLIGKAIAFLLGAFGAIALLMFIIGGFMWMTSMGDEKKIHKGMETIKWAALGIVVAFSSYAIIKMVFEMFAGA